MPAPAEQLDSIQAMLAAGHRSVHLERHTLLLLGAVGGFLIYATELVITAERFPDHHGRAVALLLWLAFWLGGVSLLDHRLTRRARRNRAETLPFAQAQITRAWWMLLTMGALGSFAMFFYGGGAMVYGLWIVLLGLGIYLFGLFSRPVVEWIGLAGILLGVTALSAGLPFGATRWLCTACFAIGMPAAAWLARRDDDSRMKRIGAVVLWLVLVAIPPLVFVRLSDVPAPEAGERVLHLAAGDRVPLRVDLESPLLSAAPSAAIDLRLSVPVDVVLAGGQPDGRYRIADGPWHRMRDGVLQLSIDRIAAQFSAEAAEVRMHAVFRNRETEESRP